MLIIIKKSFESEQILLNKIKFAQFREIFIIKYISEFLNSIISFNVKFLKRNFQEIVSEVIKDQIIKIEKVFFEVLTFQQFRIFLINLKDFFLTLSI